MVNTTFPPESLQQAIALVSSLEAGAADFIPGQIEDITAWAQDEQSGVIYGMPAAIVDAGLADRVLAPNDIGPTLAGCT